MNPDSIEFSGFYWSHRVGLLMASAAFLLLVLELVRREHLKERYALLWLGAALCGLTVGIFPRVIIWVSASFGFQYITVFYVASFLFLLLLVLSFTVVISSLSERNRILAQEIALLSRRIDELKDSRDDGA